MKKIAICLSGHVRSYRLTHPGFIDNVIKPNLHHHIDIFLSTWRHTDTHHSGQIDRLRHWGQLHELPQLNYVDIADLYDKYNPVKILVEREEKWDVLKYVEKNFTHPLTNPSASLNMTYKMLSGDKLRRDYMAYDVVIRTRFDLIMDSPIVVDNYNTDEFFYLPTMHMPNLDGHPWCNDKFAIGNSHNMAIYSELFNAIPELHFEHNIIMQPEIMLHHHLKRNNIPTASLERDFEIDRRMI